MNKETDPLLKKKIIAQYNFLRVEVEYQKTQFDNAVKAFDKHFNPKIEDNEAKAGPVSLPKIEKDDKKLAQKVHPDKSTGNDKKFQDLREAVNNHDVGKILEIASEFDVDISDESGIDMNVMYVNGIQKLEAQLQQWMTTAAWQWYHADGEARERIERGILELYQ